MSYPNTTYSYVEMLNWSKITKSASGNYTCQVTSVYGASFNKTVSLLVQSMNYLISFFYYKLINYARLSNRENSFYGILLLNR